MAKEPGGLEASRDPPPSPDFGRPREMPKPPRPCPNPLFAQWLREWRDQAARDGRLRSQQAYERALSSLHKYPLPLHSGREARVLQYFGEKICHQLDERLERHLGDQALTGVRGKSPELEAPVSSQREQEEGCSPPSCGSTRVSDVPVVQPPRESAQRPGKHTKEKQPASHKRGRSHLPARRSAAYAILLALYRDRMNPNSRGYLTKPELQRAAQPLCDKSFCLIAPGSKNTAWSTVGTLIRKELVLKTNIPARFSLTEAGVSLAQQLGAMEEETHKGSTSASSSAAAARTRETPLLLDREDDRQEGKEASTTKLCQGEPLARRLNPQFILHPGQFEIILCVDFIETTGGPTSRKQDLVKELQRNHVAFSVRKLHVGDFLWVARERTLPVTGEPQPVTARELVLDYVVERKRMPDLCSSIIDGRFREQKFRLRQCGISHPIYLVEDSGSGQHLSLPEKTLQQAIVNTQVVDGFSVKRTHDIRESAAFLTLMTRRLASLYGDRTLLSCTKEELEREHPVQPSDGSCCLLTFAEFNEGAVKNKAQTVREVFARQLMQIGGISGEKAIGILEKYETPASLLAAYATCSSSQDQEQLLSNIKCGKLQRNLGPVLSKTLAQLYCTPGSLL